MNNILITGAGGREHAIGSLIKKQHPEVQLFFSSGNGGTSSLGTNIGTHSVQDLLKFAEENDIHLTIVGSEDLLVDGIVDAFQKKGLAIFGPHQQAAQLEGSKAFAKTFMNRHGIKTAMHQTCHSTAEALDFITHQPVYPIVIKASGLAAGKGVAIVHSLEEARQVIHQMMEEKMFGEAGETLVIEEYLEGFEVSVLSIYNGRTIYPFLSAKDHKRLLEKDEGPNTGGMGVIAPHPLTDEHWWKAFHDSILIPTQQGLEKEHLQFSGVIFFGLMTTSKGIYLLEYNVRLGDPETQALLPLMKSDFLQHLRDALSQKPIDMEWEQQKSCCVVVCAKGYPLAYDKGNIIKGLENIDCPYFVAGAIQKEHELYSSGGRVLNIVGVGETMEQARHKAYGNIDKILFADKTYRKDIGIIH